MTTSPRSTGEPSGSRPGTLPEVLRTPYGLVVKDVAGGNYPRRSVLQPTVLSLRLPEGKALPVFGSGPEAKRFAEAWNERLRYEGASPAGAHEGWRGRVTGAGELISLLSGSEFSAGPCDGVDRVVFDPPVEAIPAIRGGRGPYRAGALPRGVSRARFLETLMGRGKAWFEGSRGS